MKLCLSQGRFSAYITLAILMGSESQAQWNDFLERNWPAVASTTTLLVICLVIFAVMIRNDCRKRREELG